jgi:RNA polymerase-interacting CarD/CdnL/TRCF family regulator
MNYQIGDRVIHWNHGPGTIIAIDEKILAGQSQQYYVIETGQLTLWVVIDKTGEDSIRPPTGSFEFKTLLNSLRSPGKGLPDHHNERRNELVERMQKRKLGNICGVIRDLTTRSQLQNLNYNDRAVLKQAEECLIDEWQLTLGSTRTNALRELEVLMREDQTAETAAGK